MLTVYSTEGAPGASTTAMHLASRWASAGREVLLVELDPAGGSLSHNLGIQFTPGSASFVASGMPILSNHLIDHAQDVLFENLHVMPAPASPTGARGIFSTFADFALDLRAISENELAVVIDGGRLRAETVASALTTEAAGVALVCRSNSQLSDLDDLAKVLAASSGHGPQGLAVSVGKPPMDPDEWREAHGLDFCGAIEIVPGVANDLSAYLARGKRRSKKWQNSLDKVAEKLYPYAHPPPSGATQRGRPAVTTDTTDTDAAEGSDAPDSEAAPAEASAGHEQAPTAPVGLTPDHTMPKAPVPVAAYDQPQPGHEPRPAYDQPHYLPPSTWAGSYEQAPPPYQQAPYEQPQPSYEQAPPPYQQAPYEQSQPATMPPQAAEPEPQPSPDIKPTGSFRDWARKLHGSNAADVTARRGG